VKTALFSRQRAAISWQKEFGDGFSLLPAAGCLLPAEQDL